MRRSRHTVPSHRRRCSLPSAALALLLALLSTAAATAAELSGQLQLLARGGDRPARGEDVRQAVIWFEPEAAVAPRPAESYDVVTTGKEFVPRVLALPTGSTVRFPNRDPILHNVFSVSEDNAFDLGLLGRGNGAEVTFEQSGVVRVFCNVHHSMVAYLVVLSTPYYTSPDARGAFTLSDLPAGPGRLHVFYERSDPLSLEVTLPHPAPLQVALEISKPRVPPHLNKLGRRYGRSRSRY